MVSLSETTISEWENKNVQHKMNMRIKNMISVHQMSLFLLALKH